MPLDRIRLAVHADIVVPALLLEAVIPDAHDGRYSALVALDVRVDGQGGGLETEGGESRERDKVVVRVESGDELVAGGADVKVGTVEACILSSAGEVRR
jgi:hypothetical protein